MTKEMAKKQLKTARHAPAPLWALLFLALVFTFAGSVLFNYAELNKQRARISAMQESISILEKNAQLQLEENQKKYARISEEIQSKEQKIDQAFRDIATIHTEVAEERKLRTRVERFIEILSQNTLAPNPPKSDGQDKPFSYYRDPKWQEKVSHFLSTHAAILNEGWKTQIAIGNLGPVIYSREPETFIVNGFYHQGVNRYRFDNQLENVVFVTKPGLASISQDTITILGDTELDRVILDGCLKWTKERNVDQLSVWKAEDSDKEIRRVKITATVTTSIEDACKGNYFEKEMENRVTQNLRNSATKKSTTFDQRKIPEKISTKSSFGGVGFRFKKTKYGVYITEILPGTPAESGGLYAGDIIIKIDQNAVKYMDNQKIMDALRGPPGTPTTLHYMPSGSVSTVKETTLIRSIINPEE